MNPVAKDSSKLRVLEHSKAKPQEARLLPKSGGMIISK
jgi:hypothetical protein